MALPSPPPDLDLGDVEVIGVEVILGLGLALALALTIGGVLLLAARRLSDAMVTVSVSILTMVAIVGFLITRQEALVTLAGAGMGALAGAVTHLFGSRPDDDDAADTVAVTEPDQEVVPDE